MTTTIAFVNWASPDIVYSGSWGTYGDQQHKGTAVPGSYLTFDFNGTQVWVAGTLYPLQGGAPWVVTFTVDGKSPAAVLTGPDAPADQSNTGLWGSQTLSGDTQHQLVVEVTSATTNTPFLLDQLLFIPVNPQPTTTQSEVTYTTTTPPQVTITVSSLPDGKDGVPIGAIVGGVVAGITVLAIAGILVFYWFRRRRHGKPYFYDSADAAELLNDEPHSVPLFDAKAYSDDNASADRTPAPLYSTISSHGIANTAYSQSEYSQSSYAASSVHPTSTSQSDLGRRGASSSVSGSNPAYTITPYRPISSSSSLTAAGSPFTRASGKAAEAGPLSVAPQATFHADSGIRFNAGPSGEASSSGSGSGAGQSDADHLPTDVPPSYTPN